MYGLNYQTQAYRKVNVETANPGRILLTLYDAAIRFVKAGMVHIQEGNAGAKGISLGKAHSIIAEFINSPDHKVSPELCKNLELIYIFMIEKIAEANNSMSVEPLIPVVKHLEEMRETWAIAVNQSAVEESRKIK